MTNELKSYVDKYINSVESSVHVGEVGNEESWAHVEEAEGSNNEAFVSKLRARKVSKLSDRDKRYKDKKISKHCLSNKKDNSTAYDPSLAKYFCADDDDEVEYNPDKMNCDLDKSVQSGSSSCSEDEFDANLNNESEHEYGDDEEGDLSENDDSDADNQSTNIENVTDKFSVQAFSRENDEYKQKALAVKNQFSMSDSMFETRIGLQKCLTHSNRLPQQKYFKSFLNVDEKYKKSLQKARSEAKKLLVQLILLQEDIVDSNCETKGIFEGSFHSVIESENKELMSDRKSKKRKVEQIEDLLTQRHKEFYPYRDNTLTTWHKRSQMLRSGNASSNFSSFDSSIVKQMQDILSNRDQLLKRTQLVSVERGNQFNVIGKEIKDGEKLCNYDPEIYDDGDFYSQQLEYVLKSKMSSNNNSTIAQSLANVFELRRKTRKKVIAKSAKSRRLKYEVMSLMQNYLAPCKFPTFSEDATEKLFSSLFGQSLGKKNKI